MGPDVRVLGFDDIGLALDFKVSVLDVIVFLLHCIALGLEVVCWDRFLMACAWLLLFRVWN